MQQMEIWSTTISKHVYEEFLDEGASFLSEWNDANQEKIDTVLASYHNLAARTRSDWGTYEKTGRYRRIWSTVDSAAKNRARNEAKRENAHRRVQEVWQSDGTRFMEINDAIQWSIKVKYLANKVNDYDTAMLYLNRILYERRLRTDQRHSCDLTPGGTDLENACARAKETNEISSLSDEELDAGKPGYSLCIGEDGILTYGENRQRGRIKEAGHNKPLIE
jgi:hypothetical protein